MIKANSDHLAIIDDDTAKLRCNSGEGRIEP
jgi:hypothetical protein